MPSLIHQTESGVRPRTPVEAKGGPLSERIALGSPNSSNANRGWAGRARCPGCELPRSAKESAARVAQRQRIAAIVRGQPEVALEVDAPDVVGLAAGGEGLRERRRPPPPPTRRHEAVALEHLADRAG